MVLGEPFEIGSKLLHKNMKQLGQKSKLFKRFTGPYIVVGHCSTGSVYLKDCFSHQLWCTMAPNQLIRFNECSKYGISDDSTICNAGSSDEAGCSGLESSDTVDNTVDSTCQRARITNYVNTRPKTSTPVKLKQIIIVSSQEQQVSSDESVTIDVVSPVSPLSPKVSNLNNILLDEMSIEIIDDLNDKWQTSAENCKPPVMYFNPLTDVDRYQAVLKFNIKVGPSHMVKTSGNSTVCHTHLKFSLKLLETELVSSIQCLS